MRKGAEGWVVLLIPFSLSVHAGQPLDLGEMDQITAAGVNPQFNWIQREGETVVAAGAIANVKVSASVNLEGDVQSGTDALNLINAAASDSVQLLNVAIIDDENTKLDQTNSLEQNAQFVGSLAHLYSDGPTVYHQFERIYSSVSGQAETAGFIQIDTSNVTVTTTSNFDVAITKYDPTKDFTIPLNFSPASALWDGNGSGRVLQIPDMSIGGTFSIDLFGIGLEETGLEASLRDATISLPALDLGVLHFINEDIFLENAAIHLPGIDFGMASVRACWDGDCLVGNTSLPAIPSARIGFDKILIPGVQNPFGDTEIWDVNLATGIIAMGSGRGTLTGPGASVTVTLELNFNDLLTGYDVASPLSSSPLGTIVSAIPGPVGDIAGDIIGVIEDFPILGDAVNAVFSIVPINQIGSAYALLPTLTFEETYEFIAPQTLEFDISDLADCSLVLFGGCERTQTAKWTVTDTSEDGTFTDLTDRYDTSQMSYHETETTLTFMPGNLEGAQADMIVMTDSSLIHEKDNSTRLSDGAQRNVNTLNAINASRALIGNASNMATQRSQINYSSVQNQSNRFVQIR